jgi:hypothetical protein
MDVHAGIEGTNSNGHGKVKEESMNLVEIINFFQKDVQSYKGGNERIMKVKEKKEELNLNLMQILDIIENKMDKENDSRKSRSHKSPDEKGRTRSVRKNHLHSPRHSNRRENSSSNTSHVRKHKKRSQVDELQG